jgi:membrane-bound lytic murein transglycosylase B
MNRKDRMPCGRGKIMRCSKQRRDREDGAAAVAFTAFFLSLVIFFSAGSAWADWSPLIKRLVDDRLDEQAVRALFSRPEVLFDPLIMSRKVETLVRKRTFRQPAYGVRKFPSVYKTFMRPEMIEGARAYLRENSVSLDEVRTKYGVPKEIVVSILLVETRLGEYVGEKYAFNTLASMALCTDLEMIRPYLSGGLLTPENEDYARRRLREKSNWAYKELRSLIVYAKKVGLDPLKIPGSFYGAIGICQFMPSHAVNYGVDADNDGRVDLFTRADAFHSIGNYLRGHGWKSGMSRTRKHKVIRAYNPSNTYANTVLAVADKLTAKRTVKKQPKKKPQPQINPA